MRTDLRPGEQFPDIELPDQDGDFNGFPGRSPAPSTSGRSCMPRSGPSIHRGEWAGRGKMSDGQRYFMRTERLGFQCWAAKDLPLAVAIWGQPEVTRLIADLANPSEEQARRRLAREMANQEAFGVQYWPLFRLDGGAPRVLRTSPPPPGRRRVRGRRPPPAGRGGGSTGPRKTARLATASRGRGLVQLKRPV
jgi:hypothetical protein